MDKAVTKRELREQFERLDRRIDGLDQKIGLAVDALVDRMDKIAAQMVQRSELAGIENRIAAALSSKFVLRSEVAGIENRIAAAVSSAIGLQIATAIDTMLEAKVYPRVKRLEDKVFPRKRQRRS